MKGRALNRRKRREVGGQQTRGTGVWITRRRSSGWHRLRYEPLETRVVPATVWTVDYQGDEADGIYASGDLSLREAVSQAANGDTIQFSVSLSGVALTLDPVLGEIPITQNLGIVGLGAENLTISGGHASRIFHVAASANVSISGMTIRDGQAENGGGILNLGNLQLDNCVLVGNVANSSGGAISANNGARVTLTSCIVADNSATTDSGGIAAFNSSVLTISNSVISGNRSIHGGGILVLSNSTLDMSDSSVTNNEAATDGGGLYLYGSTGTIIGSTFSGNAARTTGWGSPGGGAIKNDSGSTLTLTNSTVANNSSDSTGGAVQNYNSSLILESSTIVGNIAASTGGGIHRVGGAVRLHNTMLADNKLANAQPDDISGSSAVNSLGFNLIGFSGSASGWSANDLLNVAPLVGPLGDYGGPTQTVQLLPESPALNGGDPLNSAALVTDQRGLARVSNGRLDIGAYELQVTPPDTVPPQVADSSVRGAGVLPTGAISLSLSFSEPVLGVELSSNFSLHNTGADGMLNTLDDVVVPVNADGSEEGVVLSFAPLSEGVYRLRVSDAITDVAGNLLDGDYDQLAGGWWRGDFVVDAGVGSGIQAVSTSLTTGTMGNRRSHIPSISGDGRYVAFASEANNLVVGDTNQREDIFVKDLQTGAVTLVSTNSSGMLGNQESALPSISSDGRYIAFFSGATNLVAGDSNGNSDVFVKDLQTGIVTMVSASSEGELGNGISVSPSISRDGRYVAFRSYANNLVAGDTNGRGDIFVKDLQTGDVTLVSKSSSEALGNADSHAPSISSDGRYVAFQSYASNLVAGDANGYPDIFVKDLQIGSVTVASSNVSGVLGNEHSQEPSISGDGRYVAFQSTASNLAAGVTNGQGNIFVKDLQTGSVSTVSASSSGVLGNSDAYRPSISSDGRYVAFHSFASNLVSSDTNNTTDVFVKDLQSGSLRLVSMTNSGVLGATYSNAPSISNDGRHVAYQSGAFNLVSGDNNEQDDILVTDLQTGSIEPISTAIGPTVTANDTSSSGSVSADGRYVAFSSNASNLVAGDTNGRADIFIKDVQTNTVTLVSASSSGVLGNGMSYTPKLSSDGRYVAFQSYASNLVAGDTNGYADIFVKDLHTGTVTLVSTSNFGTLGNRLSEAPNISSDGRYVVFLSYASNLVAGDTNELVDIFINDLQTGTVNLVSASRLDESSNGWSYDPTISGDGRYVAFRSYANNLVAGDTNGRGDIFVKDLQTGDVTLVSKSNSEALGNADSHAPSISSDGRYVAFQSYASNLVAGDANGFPDVFVKDLQTGAVTLVSTSSSGALGNSWSQNPSLSSDGRYVTFHSYSSNLVADDTNGTHDIFVKDLQTDSVTLVSKSSLSVLGNSASYNSSFNGDGRYVIFHSFASNLVSGDWNNSSDVFLVGNPLAGMIAAPRIDLVTSTGYLFDVDTTAFGTGQLIQGTNGAFDGLLRLQINGVDFAPVASQVSTTNDGGRTLVTPSVAIGDLNVSREVTVPTSGIESFARTVESLANPTNMPVSVSVRLVGNLGSDAATQVFMTSDGNSSATAGDEWVATDDGDSTGTPAVVHLIHGPHGVRPESLAVDDDNVIWNYQLTIPANSTVRLAHFVVVDESRVAAISAAQRLVTTSGWGGEATAFLSAMELQSIANFQFGTLTTELDAGDLIITDTSDPGRENHLTIRLEGTDLVVSDLQETFVTVPPQATLSLDRQSVRIPSLLVSGAIRVLGAGGTDTLTIDFAGGDVIPAGGLSFNGGESASDHDQLKLVGYNLTTADGVADVTVTHTGPKSGSVSLLGLGTVSFGQIEPLALAGNAADLSITLPSGADNATLGDDGVVQDPNGNTLNTSALYDGTGPGYSFEYTEFTNPSNSLVISSGATSADLNVLNLVTAELSSSLTLGSAGGELNDVTFNGPVTLSADKNLTVNAWGTISAVNSSADLTASGAGNISLTTARNIALTSGSSVISANGNVTLQANTAGTTTGNFVGIDVNGATVNSGAGALSLNGRGGVSASHQIYGVQVRDAGLVTSGGGDVAVEGTGGFGSGIANYGVYVNFGGTINAGGTGALNVTGTGGLGSGRLNHGVAVAYDASISSADGSVSVVGFAGGDATSGDDNYGVWIYSGSAVTSVGDGPVSVQGTGGPGPGSYNVGVYVDFDGSVTSGGIGAVAIDGTGGSGSGSEGYGVWVYGNDAVVSSGGGDISLAGVSGGHITSAAVRIENFGIVTTAADGGNIAVAGDTIDLDATATISANFSHTVTLRPATSGTAIQLGAADSTGVLGLTDTELDRVSAGTLIIGAANSGGLTVSSAIDRTAPTHMQLMSGSAIAFNPGSIDTAGGTLLLDAGPAGVQPITTGTDATASSVAFGSGDSLAIHISGATVDTQYRQLNVAGAVNLTGSNLLLTENFSGSTGTETLTIVAASNGVSGSFTGLPDGTTLAIGPAFYDIKYHTHDVQLVPAGSLVAGLSGGNLTITDFDPTGVSHNLTVRLVNDGTDLEISDANERFSFAGVGTLSADHRTLTVPLSLVTGSLTINTGGGSDVLSVDFAGGDVIPAGGLSFRGGENAGDHDQLRLVGYSLNTADGVADVTATHTGPESGNVILAGLGTVSFVELEPLTLGGSAADLVIVLPAGADNVTLGDDGVTQDPNGNTLNTSALYDSTGPAYSFEFTEFSNPLNSLTIGRGSASDDLRVMNLVTAGLDSSLALGSVGSEFNNVTLSGPVALSADRNLTVHASGTIQLASSTADLAATGTGDINLITARNIVLVSGASLQTSAGDITLQANLAGTTAGNFVGIDISGATVNSGTGELSVQGRGGVDINNFNHGVHVRNSGQLTSGGGNVAVTGIGGGSTTSGRNFGVAVETAGRISAGGTGTVTVIGTGGATSGSDNRGVYVANANSQITSSGGNIIVNGTGGGTGTGGSNPGVHLDLGGQILAGGSGTVHVIGVGASSAGAANHGVRVSSVNSQITSSGGNVTVTGNGGGSGTSNFDLGVMIASGGRITAGGTGEVSVAGTGGHGSGGSSWGVYLDGTNSLITSSGGNVTVTGTGSVSAPNTGIYGVYILSAGQITAPGTANVTVTGHGGAGSGGSNHGVRVQGANSQITSGGGPVVVTGTGGGGTASHAVQVDTAGAITTAANGGDLTIIGDSMNFDATATIGANASHSVALRPATSGNAIHLGAADSPGVLGLTDAELDRVAAGVLRIGSSTSGPISVSQAVHPSGTNTLQLVTASGFSQTAGLTISNLSVEAGAAVAISDASVDVVAVRTTAGSINVYDLNGYTIGAVGDVYGMRTPSGTISPTAFDGDIVVADTPALIDIEAAAFYSLNISQARPNRAVIVAPGAALVAGDFQIITDRVQLDGTLTSNANLNATFITRSSGRAIDLGSTTDTGAALELSDAELDRITVGAIQLGDSVAGPITVTQPLTPTSSLQLTSGSTISLSQSVAMSANKSFTANSAGTINLQNANADLATSGSGTILLNTARNIALASGSSVSSEHGNVTLQANLAGTTAGDFVGVDVQGATVNSGAGTLTVLGYGGAGTGSGNYGVQVRNNGLITSGGGPVAVTGVGGGSGPTTTFNMGLAVLGAGQITAGGSGQVVATGTGGAVSGSANYGVYVSGANSRITSSGGNVLVSGTGGGVGTSGSNRGVLLNNTAQITAGGAGQVEVIGHGGLGSSGNQMGVEINSAGFISSSGGSVTVTGVGGGSGGSSADHGVLLEGAAQISAGGTGNVTVSGAGGAGTAGQNHGVQVTQANTRITSQGGPVLVIGQTGNGAFAYGVALTNSGAITTATQGGPIVVSSDSVGIASSATISASSTGMVTLQPKSPAAAVNLGSGDSPGLLGLTDAELDLVSAGTLVIGSANTQGLTISSVIGRGVATNVQLKSGGAITFNPGSIDTAGGALLLDAGPAGVQPITAGTDVAASSLAFGSGDSLAIHISGATVDSQYPQLNVAGAVDLTGSSLVLTDSFPGITGTETFTIVSATGGVTGTFHGLPNGSTTSIGPALFDVKYHANDVQLVPAGSLTAALINGQLTISDSDSTGRNNDLIIKLINGGAELEITDAQERFTYANVGTVSNGGKTLTLPFALVTGSLTINTAGGTDVLTVDLAGGDLIPAGGLSFGGGTNTDRLVIASTQDLTWNITSTNAGSVVSSFGTLSFSGTEQLTSGAGNDTYVMSVGATIDGLVAAGAGADVLNYAVYTTPVNVNLGTGTATGLLGGISGFENVTGGVGADLLTGDDLDNVLVGNGGNDTLTGNAGNDRLIGGAGSDTLIGGAGNDKYEYDTDLNLGSDTINESGGGSDTLDFSQTETRGVTLNLTATNNQNVNAGLTLNLGSTPSIEHVIGGVGNDVITVSGFTGVGSLVGNGGSDTVVATKNADFALQNSSLVTSDGLSLALFGFSVANLTGGAGNDTFNVTGWTGSGTLVGGQGGADRVVLQNSGDFILSNSSLLATGGPWWSLTTMEVADLVGSAANNVFDLAGWTGNGSLTGAAGSDTIRISRNANFLLSDTGITAGTSTVSLSGVEVAHLTGGNSANTFDVSGWTGSGSLTGGGGSDSLTVTKNGLITLTDSGVTAADGMNVALAGIVTANLSGGLGNDTFDVRGWTSEGTLQGNGTGDVDTVVAQGAGLFTLSNNELTIGSRPDLTLVSIESAELLGSAGDEIFEVSDWTGTGSLSGGGGSDEVTVVKDAHMVLLDSSLTVDGGLALNLMGISRARLTGGSGNNVLDASAFSGIVVLFGDDGNDILLSGTGDDQLNGGKGNDTLVASAGADLLNGDDGRDLLFGGTGADTLDGGSDDDIVISSSSDYDQNLAALDAIMTQWSSSLPFTDRVANLISELNGSTVHDDDSVDNLTGGKGLDWFFSHDLEDLLKDLDPRGRERVTYL